MHCIPSEFSGCTGACRTACFWNAVPVNDHLRTLCCCGAGALAGAAALAVALAVFWLYRRNSQASTTSSQMMLLAESDSGEESVEESLELVTNGRGEPVELGSGSYGKVRHQIMH